MWKTEKMVEKSLKPMKKKKSLNIWKIQSLKNSSSSTSFNLIYNFKIYEEEEEEEEEEELHRRRRSSGEIVDGN